MKASLFLAVSGAVLAVAKPVAKLDKRVMETEYVTDIIYVTVTEGEPAPTEHAMMGPGAHKYNHWTTTLSTTSTTTSSSVATVTSTSTPPPPPATSSSTPPPPPPPPAPSTPANVVTTITEEAPAPQPTTQEVQVQVVQAPASPSPAPAPQSSTPAPAPSAPAADVAAAPAAPSDFPSTGVYHHNLHRNNHSAPAMSWDDTYAGYAAQVAASCVFAHNLGPGGGGYGQNIAMYAASGDVESMGATKALAQAVTDMWYNGEVWQYPADGYGESNPDMTNFESWGHFSQVVWVGSTQVGCAAQYCAPGTMFPTMGAWFTVCDYAPAGNVGGGYGTNVLKPLGQETVTA